MRLSRTERLAFRLDKISKIDLQSRAESKEMTLSEYVEYCINSEIIRSKKEENSNARLTDFEKLLASLVEINSAARSSKEIADKRTAMIIKGIVQIQKAMVELFPKNKSIERIFKGEGA